MNIETLLNNLFSVIYENPNNFDFKYSNVNGKESLMINGEEMIKQFDDSKIKEEINNYKINIGNLDDCLFVDTMEELEDKINFKQMDELLNQESFNQSEANLIGDLINIVSNKIKEKIEERIIELRELRNKF